MGPFDDLIPDQNKQNPYQITQPQTPSQLLQQDATGLGMQRTQQEMDAQPLQNQNTRTNIAQGEQTLRNNNVSVVADLQSKFRGDPTVQAYREAAPNIRQMLAARPGGEGDLSVIYDWAKTMDPTGSVREGDTDLAKSVSPFAQRAALLAQQVQSGNFLSPEVRTGLIEEARSKGKALHDQYSEVLNGYRTLAQQNGLDPSILGSDEGGRMAGDEAAYIRAHGGTPRNNAGPIDAPPPAMHTEQGFGLEQPKEIPHADDVRNGLYQAMRSGQIKSYSDMKSYVDQFNQANATHFPAPPNNKETFNAIAAAKKGKSFNVTIPTQDTRTVAKIDEMKKKGGIGDALAVGAQQGVTLGAGDEINAFGNALKGSLGGEGSFSDLYRVNADANQGYLDSLQQTHPWASAGGNLLGGAALAPLTFGAQTPAELAGLSGAMGGAGGFASGSDGNRLDNAAMGAGAGAALGYALPSAMNAFGRKAVPEIPPLVDRQTGQLNQPLEAMTPGQRVVKAEEYGVNLPADAAGGRTAAVIGKGLDIMPGSAGVMEDARRATESQLAGASDVVASRFGNARTMNEAGAELQRGANERIDRGKEVISKAYNAIPISDQAQATTSNTVATLQQLTGRFQSNPELADALKNPTMNRYLDALSKGQISWRDLKDFRSRIGEMIGDHRFGEGQSTADLRALYGGLSEDMRNTASAQGPGAIRAFERANGLNRQNEELVQGALTRVLGQDGMMAPEKAASAVQAMTKGGKSTGDLKTLAQIRGATVKSGAWNEIASTLIRLGGQPANSAGRDFNPQTFVNWYADMSEPARRMLFGGGNEELRKALDGFVAVNQRLQKVNALRNTSNTAGNLTAAGTVGTMAAAISNPLLGAKLAGVMAGNYAMAKAWTNPTFVRLVTGYSKAVAAGNQSAVRSQIGRISALAATNPELREPLVALQHRLANDNFIHGAVASPDADEEHKKQYPY